MVVVNNAIKLREIQDRVLADNDIFENVNSVSTTTIARVLKKHQVDNETVIHCTVREKQ